MCHTSLGQRERETGRERAGEGMEDGEGGGKRKVKG